MSDEGYTYYYNTETEESSWEFPEVQLQLQQGVVEEEEEVEEEAWGGNGNVHQDSYVDHTAMEGSYSQAQEQQQQQQQQQARPLVDIEVTDGGTDYQSSDVNKRHNSTNNGHSQAEPLSHLNKSGQTALHISASVCNVQALSLLVSILIISSLLMLFSQDI